MSAPAQKRGSSEIPSKSALKAPVLPDQAQKRKKAPEKIKPLKEAKVPQKGRLTKMVAESEPQQEIASYLEDKGNSSESGSEVGHLDQQSAEMRPNSDIAELIEGMADVKESKRRAIPKTKAITKQKSGLPAHILRIDVGEMDYQQLEELKQEFGLSIYEHPDFPSAYAQRRRQFKKKNALPSVAVSIPQALVRPQPSYRKCPACAARIKQVMTDSGTSTESLKFYATSISKTLKRWATIPCSPCLIEMLRRISNWAKGLAQALGSSSLQPQTRISYTQILSRIPPILCLKTFDAADFVSKHKGKMEIIGYEQIKDQWYLRITLTQSLQHPLQASSVIKQHFVASSGQWGLATGITGANDGLEKYPLDKVFKKEAGLYDPELAPYNFVKTLPESFGQDFIPDVQLAASSGKMAGCGDIDFDDIL